MRPMQLARHKASPTAFMTVVVEPIERIRADAFAPA